MTFQHEVVASRREQMTFSGEAMAFFREQVTLVVKRRPFIVSRWLFVG